MEVSGNSYQVIGKVGTKEMLLPIAKPSKIMVESRTLNMV